MAFFFQWGHAVAHKYGVLLVSNFRRKTRIRTHRIVLYLLIGCNRWPDNCCLIHKVQHFIGYENYIWQSDVEFSCMPSSALGFFYEVVGFFNWDLSLCFPGILCSYYVKFLIFLGNAVHGLRWWIERFFQKSAMELVVDFFVLTRHCSKNLHLPLVEVVRCTPALILFWLALCMRCLAEKAGSWSTLLQVWIGALSLGWYVSGTFLLFLWCMLLVSNQDVSIFGSGCMRCQEYMWKMYLVFNKFDVH